MTRPTLIRLVAASALLSLGFPLAYASAEGPIRHPTSPSDTLTKLEKSRSERPSPAPKKKLKARQAPPAPALRPEFVPDQPWETDFFVENEMPARSDVQIALASYRPRH